MQRAFQVGKADVGINNQTFHLMEHRRVSLVVVVTINTARRDDTNRWLLGFHGADLYARGWVRSRRVASNQKVSWSARAGWDQGMFRASKL